MRIKSLGYTDFIAQAYTIKKLALQHEETDGWYDIYAFDGDSEQLLTRAVKGTDDATDYETKYKATANMRVSQQLDSDNASMSRIKVAPSGWNFNFRGVEITTAKLNSLVNKDATNADLSDAVLKLYDSDGALITTTLGQSNCVKTVLDIEPPYDIYVAGGKMKFIAAPATNVRVAVIGVPDVPAIAGGSKPFVQNVNLKFLPAAEGLNADGRAAKWLQYSATYHTNKLRFILYHDAGYQMDIAVFMETYKQ